MNTVFKPLEFLQEFEFARISIIISFLIGLLSGMISPLVVLRRRGYLVDAIAHMILPGVVVGLSVSKFFGTPVWLSLFMGAAVAGLLGTFLNEYMAKRLQAPPESATIIILAGFLSLGVVLLSRFGDRSIPLDHILFGDSLLSSWEDVWSLLITNGVCLFVLLGLQKHWDCWLCDQEFAQLTGYKTKLLEIVFPILMTLCVLSAMFTVGGLLVSCLFTIPAVLMNPQSVFSPKTILVSCFVSLLGWVLSFQLDAALGPTIVLLSIFLLLLKLGFRVTSKTS